MNFFLNFKEAFKYLIPAQIRGVKNVDWIGALLAPIQSLNVLFNEYVLGTRYDLSFNGQVVYLEHVLNDMFDDVSRRIYIDDPSGQQVYTPYVFNRVEQQPPLIVTNKSEALPTPFLYNTPELVVSTDFVVNVPTSVLNATVQNQMKALINKYRIAGKRYTFATF
jgi:hypothetical protein